MPSFGNFLHTQLIVKIPIPNQPLTSQTILITGANSGLGKETAEHILRLGAATVVLGCRNIASGTQAAAEIKAAATQSIGPSKKIGDVQVWPIDLEDPSSIRDFVQRANALPRLDIVIHNAGIHTFRFGTVYGTERSVGVNTIGTFLLAVQLIPKLRETAARYSSVPRMTFVSSALYDVAKWPEDCGSDIFEYYRDEKNMPKMGLYNNSKLLQLYAIIKLAATIDPKTTNNPHPIVINALDPCYCKTELGREVTGVLKFVGQGFEAAFARTAEEGSRLIVRAASAGRETHGAYMRAGAVQKYAPIAQDEEKAKYVWDLLCKKLEILQPGILQNLQL